MTLLKECEVETTTLERIRVICSSDIAGDVLRELHADGYDVRRTGPYSDRKMFPRVDTSRSLIIAERESQ